MNWRVQCIRRKGQTYLAYIDLVNVHHPILSTPSTTYLDKVAHHDVLPWGQHLSSASVQDPMHPMRLTPNTP